MVREDLILIGGGGHCHSCIDVIEAQDRYQVRGIVERYPVGNRTVLGYPILGTDEDLPLLVRSCPMVFVAVGQIRNPNPRVKIFESVESLGAQLPVIVAPSSHVSKHANIGAGSLVSHGAVISALASVGVNCIVNSQALIEHDAQVSEHCHVSTGARINGGSKVGPKTFVGSGAILSHGVVVGANCVIGAGAVVLDNVPDGTLIAPGDTWNTKRLESSSDRKHVCS